MSITNTIITSAVFGLTTAAFAAGTTKTVNLNGYSAMLTADTLVHAYGLKATSTDAGSVVHADALSCVLAAGAAVPTCQLTIGTQTVVATRDAAAAAANLYQLIATNGGARSGDAGATLVDVTGLDCLTPKEDYSPERCTVQAVSGAAAPAAAATTISVTGDRADKTLAALFSAGLPSVPNTPQWTWHVTADKVSCSVLPKTHHNNPTLPLSCKLVAGSQTYTVTEAAALPFYRMLAEAGGAKLDPTYSQFTATATKLDCINNDTHEDGVATCSFSLDQRVQVLNTYAAFSLADESEIAGLQASLLEAKAAVKATDDQTSITLEKLNCSIPTLHNHGLGDLICQVQAEGQDPRTITGRASYAVNDPLFNVLDSQGLGARLDPSDLNNTLVSGSVRCTLSKSLAFPSSCVGFALRAAPL